MKKMFPVSLLFNSERWMQWRMGYNQYHNGDANASIFLMQFETPCGFLPTVQSTSH
ncbi:MAG: hypothetical protein ACLSAH_19125 [Bilophila wadsworthia]